MKTPPSAPANYNCRISYITMKYYWRFLMKSIGALSFLSLSILFSCENDIKKVGELANVELLPVIHATGIETIYSDSAIVQFKITAPELKEFNETEDREAYMEFPQGLKVVFYDNNGRINSSLQAEYAIYWKKSKLHEARTNVAVKNFDEKQELYTEQLFWDQEEEKIWSDKFVKIITENGPTYGEEGFESDQNFTKFRIRKSRGQMTVEDDGKK